MIHQRIKKVMNIFSKRHRLIDFAGGYGLAIFTFAACATIFPYQYYATQMDGGCYDQGKLLGKVGKDGWPDLPLSECKPDPIVQGQPSGKQLKCITMIDSDFYSLKADDMKCHLDLSSCQKGGSPTAVK